MVRTCRPIPPRQGRACSRDLSPIRAPFTLRGGVPPAGLLLHSLTCSLLDHRLSGDQSSGCKQPVNRQPAVAAALAKSVWKGSQQPLAPVSLDKPRVAWLQYLCGAFSQHCCCRSRKRLWFPGTAWENHVLSVKPSLEPKPRPFPDLLCNPGSRGTCVSAVVTDDESELG